MGVVLAAGCVTGSSNSATQSSPVTEIARDSRFAAYSDGTVLDNDTGLMWASTDNGGPIVWDDAKSYCRNYKGGGFRDWRMPTLNELTALYDPSINNTTPPAEGCNGGCHLTNFIHLHCCPVWYWNGIDEVAGFFHFKLGPKDWRDQSLQKNHPRALPVRNAR